jgi:hypothetical protein
MELLIHRALHVQRPAYGAYKGALSVEGKLEASNELCLTHMYSTSLSLVAPRSHTTSRSSTKAQCFKHTYQDCSALP